MDSKITQNEGSIQAGKEGSESGVKHFSESQRGQYMTTAERTTAVEERLEVVTWYDTKKFHPDMETYHNFNNI